ncbi:MAG: glycoside hydrolase family 27 protein [Bacteroidales bacterium]|nr:glycoside hydrolase family 27 protein [Bacteroidales bacterium]
MRKKILFFILLVFSIVLTSCHFQKTTNENSDTLAQKPPMGWNSWNCFGIDVTEAQVKANVDYMAEHLKQYGWEYIVVDLGWYIPSSLNTWTFKVQNPQQNMDEFGRLIPDTLKFPSSKNNNGFKPLSDYIHSKGLKFGIHIMRGIPWQAIAQNTPVKNSSALAAEIANVNDSCIWYDGLKGVDLSKTGAQEYYNSLIELYAEWGVDYIKADDMSFPYHESEIAALSNAIKKSGRPIVLSLSPGATPVEKINHLRQHANLWRISPDFWDDWHFLHRQFELCRKWQSFILPGHWPDCDMLPLGKIRKTGPDDYVVENMKLSKEELTDEYSRFNNNEIITLMSLWAIFRSPLMFGGHMPENDSLTLALLTNSEVLKVNQESTNNREIINRNGFIAWLADVPGSENKYLALFNTNDISGEFTVYFDSININHEIIVRDLWDRIDLGKYKDSVSFVISPHGAELFQLLTK